MDPALIRRQEAVSPGAFQQRVAARRQILPDGHWLAYLADSGRPDVYVIPFPGSGGKYQISTSGGFGVAWDKLNHLFYLATGDLLVQADLELRPAIASGESDPSNVSATAAGRDRALVRCQC